MNASDNYNFETGIRQGSCSSITEIIYYMKLYRDCTFVWVCHSTLVILFQLSVVLVLILPSWILEHILSASWTANVVIIFFEKLWLKREISDLNFVSSISLARDKFAQTKMETFEIQESDNVCSKIQLPRISYCREIRTDSKLLLAHEQ